MGLFPAPTLSICPMFAVDGSSAVATALRGGGLMATLDLDGTIAVCFFVVVVASAFVFPAGAADVVSAAASATGVAIVVVVFVVAVAVTTAVVKAMTKATSTTTTIAMPVAPAAGKICQRRHRKQQMQTQ